MKNLFLRSGVALACALTLASCGGSGGSLYISGAVVGLVADGLVLTNNNGPDLIVPANSTSFTFLELVGNDTDFNVRVKSSPSSAVCTASSNTGRTGTYDITSVLIQCVTNTYDLGGTVTGLDVDGLVINNGADKVAVPKGAVKFNLSKVGDGYNYGVTILAQPVGRVCSITNGTGKMGAAAVTNIQVNCV